jgi:glycosyltransferase involved in cell wall biosynthesis
VRVVQVNLVRPQGRPTPEALLEAWPTLRDVALAVRRAGSAVTVVQAFHRAAELTLDGVRFQFVPHGPSGAVAACRADVIHVHGLDFAWHTRHLCELGAPVLVQDHASSAAWQVRRRRWGLARVAGAAFTDAAQAAPFFANGSLPRGLPIFSVPESSTLFSPGNQDQARLESGIFGDPVVLWVGRLDANKDPLTALNAVERAAPELPGLRLWCCFHRADLLPAVRERIAASPLLTEHVRLLGPMSHGEVETLCQAADLFLLCSHSEGSGYALIEAIACGAAPVVSDIPSFRALTGRGALGALATPGDAADFARGLIAVARQPAAERRARSLAHFRRELSFDAVGAKLCAAYESLR